MPLFGAPVPKSELRGPVDADLAGGRFPYSSTRPPNLSSGVARILVMGHLKRRMGVNLPARVQSRTPEAGKMINLEGNFGTTRRRADIFVLY